VEPVSPFAGKGFWNHCLGYEGWRWELIGGGLYLIERLYREIRARRPTEIIKVVKHPYSKYVWFSLAAQAKVDWQMLWKSSSASPV